MCDLRPGRSYTVLLNVWSEARSELYSVDKCVIWGQSELYSVDKCVSEASRSYTVYIDKCVIWGPGRSYTVLINV